MFDETAIRQAIKVGTCIAACVVILAMYGCAAAVGLA